MLTGLVVPVVPFTPRPTPVSPPLCTLSGLANTGGGTAPYAPCGMPSLFFCAWMFSRAVVSAWCIPVSVTMLLTTPKPISEAEPPIPGAMAVPLATTSATIPDWTPFTSFVPCVAPSPAFLPPVCATDPAPPPRPPKPADSPIDVPSDLLPARPSARAVWAISSLASSTTSSAVCTAMVRQFCLTASLKTVGKLRTAMS
ncbi:hypothetical protein [Kibdelosporangium philippinense]|uniref:hypothetical protein n=1 Tax=Kibdelosporangium philippinense TaxID=211113 RepID=UPI0036175102